MLYLYLQLSLGKCCYKQDLAFWTYTMLWQLLMSFLEPVDLLATQKTLRCASYANYFCSVWQTRFQYTHPTSFRFCLSKWKRAVIKVWSLSVRKLGARNRFTLTVMSTAYTTSFKGTWFDLRTFFCTLDYLFLISSRRYELLYFVNFVKKSFSALRIAV